jgi:hypothetical protein
MTSADIAYFRARAEQEREAARQAAQLYIAEIHLELASAYEALAKHPELRTLRDIAA